MPYHEKHDESDLAKVSFKRVKDADLQIMMAWLSTVSTSLTQFMLIIIERLWKEGMACRTSFTMQQKRR